MQTGQICASHEENVVVVHPAVRICAGDVIKMSTYCGRTRRAVCSVSSLYIPTVHGVCMGFYGLFPKVDVGKLATTGANKRRGFAPARRKENTTT